jgi:biotin transporter BioY
VVLGFSGVPVFQGYKTGTQVTMGYLVGYILASYIIGKLAENGKDRKLLSSFGTMLISTPMLYIPGVAWLMYSMNITSVEKGLELGFYPFLIGDLLKILAAGLLMPGLWKIFKWTSRTKNGGE